MKPLYLNLGNLIRRIRNLVAQIMTMTDKTVNYTSELNDDTMRINASAKETVKVVNEIAHSMEVQMHSIREAEDYSNEAMETARQIVGQSDEVGEKADETIETIESSYNNFVNLIEKLDASAQAREEHPEFELFASMEKSGLRKAITLDYTEEETYVNFGHRPYFQEAINGKEFISDPYISVDTNNYCIAMSVPVRRNGEIVGILMGDLRL